MAGLDGIITVRNSEYRPCLVEECGKLEPIEETTP